MAVNLGYNDTGLLLQASAFSAGLKVQGWWITHLIPTILLGPGKIYVRGGSSKEHVKGLLTELPLHNLIPRNG